MADRVITTKVGEVTGDVTFSVAKGGDGGADIGFTLVKSRVSAANLERFLRYGMIQRPVDTAALSRDTKTGKSPTPQDKAARLRAIVEHYNSGSDAWSPARADGGMVLDGVLLAALAEAKYGGDEAKARAKVESGATKHEMTPREYLALAATADLVAPIVKRMQAERTKGVDANAMLDEDEDEKDGQV